MASEQDKIKVRATIFYGVIPSVKVWLGRAEDTQNSEVFSLCKQLITTLHTSRSNSNAPREVRGLLRKIYKLKETDSKISQDVFEIAEYLKNQFSKLSASGRMASSSGPELAGTSASHTKVNINGSGLSDEWIRDHIYKRSNENAEVVKRRMSILLRRDSTDPTKKVKYGSHPELSNRLRLNLKEVKSTDATSRNEIVPPQLTNATATNGTESTNKSDNGETSESSMEIDNLPLANHPLNSYFENIAGTSNKFKRMKSDSSASSMEIDNLPLANHHLNSYFENIAGTSNKFKRMKSDSSASLMGIDKLPLANVSFNAYFDNIAGTSNKFKRTKSDGSASSMGIDTLPLANVSFEPENVETDTLTSSLDKTTGSIKLSIAKDAVNEIDEFNSEAVGKFTIARKVGYTIITHNGSDQIVYKCFYPRCPFVLIKAESFRDHLKTDHSSLHWNRFCQACGDIVDFNTRILGILDELNHIQTVHINKESLMKDKVPFEETESPEPVPLKSIKNADESANQQSKMLRPWLDQLISKHNIAAAMMMSEDCLAAQFKCMDVKCVYFTSEAQHFEDHLDHHIQSQVAQNHFCCAYCTFEAPDSKSLVAHLGTKHQFDNYCCGFCFYRSAAVVNVQTHLNAFHSHEEPLIIECIPRLQADNKAAIKFIESASNIKKVIPRLHCFICRQAFYLRNGFKTHLESHKTYDPVKKFTCKCNQEIEFKSFLQHAEECLKINSYQCGYCRFSSNSIEPLRLHYAIKHATKLPYYLMRKENDDANSKSPQALTTCFIGQKISDYTIKRKCVETKPVINLDKKYTLKYSK